MCHDGTYTKPGALPIRDAEHRVGHPFLRVVSPCSGVICMTECAGDRGFVAPLAHFLRPLGVSVWSGRGNVSAGEAVARVACRL